jgi:hypothetical protein
MLLAAAGLALLGAGVASPVSADPTTTPRAVNGMGSDTTFRLMNGFSRTAAGSNIASWDPTGSATVDTGNPGCAAVPRANGSSAGRTALVNDTAGCLQFARSSSFSTNASLSFYPVAEDGYSYAVTQNSSIPKDLTKADVVSIYRCEVPGYVPVLPQTGSGSREDWIRHVFGSTAFPPAGVDTSCYLGGGTNNALLPQEHDGRQLTSDQIAPYSVANWIAQMNGVVSDVRGNAVLPLYNTGSGLTSPVMMNPDGAFTRTVFNVIRRSDAEAITAVLGADGIYGTADDVSPESLTATQQKIAETFVSSSAVVCSDDNTIINYGFAPVKVGATFACGARRDS